MTKSERDLSLAVDNAIKELNASRKKTSVSHPITLSGTSEIKPISSSPFTFSDPKPKSITDVKLNTTSLELKSSSLNSNIVASSQITLNRPEVSVKPSDFTFKSGTTSNLQTSDLSLKSLNPSLSPSKPSESPFGDVGNNPLATDFKNKQNSRFSFNNLNIKNANLVKEGRDTLGLIEGVDINFHDDTAKYVTLNTPVANRPVDNKRVIRERSYVESLNQNLIPEILQESRKVLEETPQLGDTLVDNKKTVRKKSYAESVNQNTIPEALRQAREILSIPPRIDSTSTSIRKTRREQTYAEAVASTNPNLIEVALENARNAVSAGVPLGKDAGYLSNLISSGADAFTNMFDVSITFEDGETVDKCRISNFTTPNRSVKTENIPFQNITVPKILASTTLERQQVFNIRVDENYQVWTLLKSKMCVDENSQFNIYDLKGKSCNIVVNSYTFDSATRQPVSTRVWKFSDCYVTNVADVTYQYGNSQAVTANVSFVYSLVSEM